MTSTYKRNAALAAVSIITLCGFLMMQNPAAAADYVVMESEGETEYRIGDIVNGDDPVSLPESASITLVSAGGEKVRVEGPFVGALGGTEGTESKELVRSLALLFREQAEWAANQQLVRSLGEEPNADPWVFDIDWKSAYCYRNPGDAALWRKKALNAGAVEISVSGDRVTSKWPKGANRLDWPADMPITEGDRYSVSLDNSDSHLIEFKKMPKDLPTRAHMAGWMAENACDDQAVLLMLTAEIDWMLSGLVKSGEF